MTNKTTKPSWDEYQDISKTLTQLLNKGYTKPMIKTVLQQLSEAGMTKASEQQIKTGYISVNINKFAKKVAEEALDNITYEGKTIREWVEIIIKYKAESEEE